MKFFINLIVVAAVITLVMIWISNSQQEPPRPAPEASSSGSIEAASTSSPSPTPEAAASTPLAPDPRVQQAASAADVTIVNVANQERGVAVTVRAYERNNLGNFLDELMKVGLKDFKNRPETYRQALDRQGRMTYQDTYTLLF